MSSLKGKKTHQSLKDSFNKEAAAALRYLYFAKLAEIEGLTAVADVFRKFAQGAECSAHGSLDFLKPAGDPETDFGLTDTESNLESALLAEARVSAQDYPAMALTARREGFSDIASWFETLAKLKKAHHDELTQTSKKVKGKK